jgi:hypothetical protein
MNSSIGHSGLLIALITRRYKNQPRDFFNRHRRYRKLAPSVRPQLGFRAKWQRYADSSASAIAVTDLPVLDQVIYVLYPQQPRR